MDAFADMWFSIDGLDWQKVSYDEGSGSNRYSSMNWAEVKRKKKLWTIITYPNPNPIVMEMKYKLTQTPTCDDALIILQCEGRD